MVQIKNLKNEEWKRITLPSQHTSKVYFVSNKARIKSVDKKSKSEQIMSLYPDHHGHLRTTIKLKNGKNCPLWVHKCMAKAFVPKPSKKHVLIIHKNFKRDDNKIKNVIWATKEEHKAYIKKRHKALGHVYHNKGGKAKLTEKKVAQIKKLILKGKMQQNKIAEKYNISATQIKRIARGENWANVKPAK